jgi:hypothetical protein
MKKVFCDSCEIEIDRDDYVSISYQFGYGSQRDGDQVEIDLCENCLDLLETNIKRIKDL